MREPSHDELLEQHFEAACGLPPGEREAFVREVSQQDPPLAAELSALLAADETDCGMLDDSAWDRLRAGDAPAEPPTWTPGREIAGYRIVRRIASGGMGHVYEAHQERPQRRVALKVLRLGLADERARRRFEFEAELLGKLEHPAIARIYEVGTLPDEDEALPFFAMEFVEGARTITEYAAEEDLDLSARVRLFRAACAGVGHGHQRRIIHRDLKPANLLVDRSGSVKVIDFGVARADGAEGRDTTVFTQEGQLLGTPAWMSPEQCAGKPAVLDTTTDVYSLGVVLFELLCGKLPIEVRGLSLTEAVRRVREEEPDLRALRDLPRDLRAIISRCLDKRPVRRYPSAGELLAELERYLDHRPVEARPPSALYQLSKLARRHRKAVGGAAAVVLALGVGLVATTVQARRAVRAEGLATERLAEVEREAQKLARIRGFLEDVFVSARPDVALGQELTVRDVVAASVERAQRELADDPEVVLPVLVTLTEALIEIGDYGPARSLLADVRDAAHENLATGDALLLHIEVLLGRLHVELGDPRTALTLLEPVLSELGRLGSPSPQRADAWECIGRAQRSLGRLEEARSAHERALALRRDAFGDEALAVAFSLHNLSILDFEERDLEQAETRQRRAIELAEHHLAEGHPWLAIPYHSLASTLRVMGRFEEAAALWTKALAIQDEVLEKDHPLRAFTLSNLAAVLVDLGEFVRAESMLGEALAARRRHFGESSGPVASTLGELGKLAARQGRADEAERYYIESIEIQRALVEDLGESGEEPLLAVTLQALALLRFRAGALGEAEELVREAIEIQRRTLDEGHPELAGNLSLLGLLQVRQGSAADAEGSLREAFAARRNLLGEDHWMTANTRSVLGECLLALDRREEARPHLEAALGILEARLPAGHPLAQEARARFAKLEERLENRAP